MLQVNNEVINKYLKDNNLSQTKFAKLCGLAPVTFRDVREGKSASITTLYKLASFMKTSICSIVKKA